MKFLKICLAIAALSCLSAPALAQQANVNLDWNPHKNVQNLNPYGANVISPEVRDDRTPELLTGVQSGPDRGRANVQFRKLLRGPG